MRSFPIHPVTQVLGKEAGLFAYHLDRLLPEVNGTQYDFEDSHEFAKRPPHEMNRVYWTEVLFRCHWAAAGAMVRTQRWLSGFRQSHMHSNLLAAAACARGLIEAAADADYTLAVVPLSLAQDHERVRAAVEGRLLPDLSLPSWKSDSSTSRTRESRRKGDWFLRRTLRFQWENTVHGWTRSSRRCPSATEYYAT